MEHKNSHNKLFPMGIERNGGRWLRGGSENCSAKDLHFAKGSTYKPQHTNTHTQIQQHTPHSHTHTHVQAISHNYHVHAMGPLGTKGNREPTNGPGGGTKHDQLDHMFCKKLHYKSSGGSGGW